MLCNEIERDMVVFDKANRELPGHVIQVRYEELALDTLNITRKMHDALGIPFTKFVRQFIESHTSEESVKVQGNAYATSVNSKHVVNEWKRKIKHEHSLRVNMACWRVIIRLGYEL
ncbi:hypothetical protein MTO96_037261 [Rhipicephalus appendiculatus]